MRYAIVSDIHANLTAWQTVLKDIADMRADKIVCLGDVTGYGPKPVEVLESVYRVVHVTLMGNHDAAICGKMDPKVFSSRAQAAVLRHREQLSEAGIEWLKTLPYEHASLAFRCAHGDFSKPTAFRYIIDAEDALPSWKVTQEQLLFVGHAHLPAIYVIGASGKPHYVDPCDFELEDGKRYIINPGSVGYPRVGDCRSSYCVYDDSTKSIHFRLLPFDSEGYRQALLEAGLEADAWLQDRESLHNLPSLREQPSFSKLKPAPAPAPVPSPAPAPVMQEHKPDPAPAHALKVHKRAPTPAPAPAPAAATPVPKPVPAPSLEVRGPVHSPPVKTRKNLFFLLVFAACIAFAAGLASFIVGRSLVPPALDVTVPDFDLPSCNAYPLTPGKNLLPVLPDSLAPDGRMDGWRYAFENRIQQTFTTGLRGGALTLCIRHTVPRKAMIESPLINLAGTQLSALRLRGQIRKSDAFSGTVLYQLITYATQPDDTLSQVAVTSFEVRDSKRKMSTPAAALNRKIDLGKRVTHVRFRIEADFDGTLELEQPTLTDVANDKAVAKKGLP